jgi:hypothetical protein
MSVTKKNIDEITRTLDTVTGGERFPGRDDTGDFKVLASAIYAYIKENILDADGTFAADSDDVAASQKAAKTYITNAVAGATGTPVGSVLIGSFIDTPDDYLLCNGVTRSRVTYSDLWDKYHKSLGTCTISVANPGVVTLAGHGRVTGERVYLTTDGTLPTGLSENTNYFVIRLGDDTFNVASSLANAEAGTGIETTGAGSGTHTCYFCPWGCGDGSTTFDLPDPRGLAIKGAGDATVNGRTKVGPVFGGVQEDALQGHWHELNPVTSNNSAIVNSLGGSTSSLLGGAVATYTGHTTGGTITDGSHDTPRIESNTRDSSIGFNFYVRYQ